MAKIVMGIGSSHSPALLMEPAAWLARAELDDKTIHQLRDFDGEVVTYDQLLERAPDGMLREIAPEVLQRRHEASQHAIGEVAKALRDADPDLVVVIGDDHKEVFQEDNMPLLSVYWGETIPYLPKGIMKWKYDNTLKPDFWYPQEAKDYPVAARFAERLIGDLIRQDFDPAHSRRYPEGVGMSHSFGYVYHRIMRENVFPIIPISINTYYPPNQITPLRAYRLGEAIREAIEAWSEPLRVVVMATGGLSHFVVDEQFDKAFLEMLKTGGSAGHAEMNVAKLQSGNSEFRCWSTLAGAVDGMAMEVIDYVPCYRSPAGTGCAMAFATWK